MDRKIFRLTRKRVLHRKVELTGECRENRKISGSPPDPMKGSALSNTLTVE
jgi:hypothetical protein